MAGCEKIFEDQISGAKAERPSLQAVQLYDEEKYTVAQLCELMEVSRPISYKYIDAEKNACGNM